MFQSSRRSGLLPEDFLVNTRRVSGESPYIPSAVLKRLRRAFGDWLRTQCRTEHSSWENRWSHGSCPAKTPHSAGLWDVNQIILIKAFSSIVCQQVNWHVWRLYAVCWQVYMQEGEVLVPPATPSSSRSVGLSCLLEINILSILKPFP